jgi:hypothetical protein
MGLEVRVSQQCHKMDKPLDPVTFLQHAEALVWMFIDEYKRTGRCDVECERAISPIMLSLRSKWLSLCEKTQPIFVPIPDLADIPPVEEMAAVPASVLSSVPLDEQGRLTPELPDPEPPPTTTDKAQGVSMLKRLAGAARRRIGVSG